MHLMHRNPALTVDAVIVKNKKILLIKRKQEPYRGQYALPGGFVEYGETVEAALQREVLEETGLVVKIKSLVDVYSDPDRDPRGHVVSVAFAADIVGGTLAAGFGISPTCRRWHLITHRSSAIRLFVAKVLRLAL
jgi:8-oxo-dGTP diphosphatase